MEQGCSPWACRCYTAAGLHTDLSYRPDLEPGTVPASPRRFSPVLTILAALVLSVGILLPLVRLYLSPKLERVPAPERALALIVSRTMDLEYALARVPAWEHVLYEVTSGGTDELAQAIMWYEELADASNEPLALVYLVVLQGEAGRLDSLHDEIKGWDQLPNPFPVYARLLRAAYLNQVPIEPAEARVLQAELRDAVPAGWFYDRLAISLATWAGDRAWLSAAQERLATRATVLLWRARELLALDVATVLLGVAIAWVLLNRRRKGRALLTVGQAVIPPRWPGDVGAVVLIRGGALWVIMMISLMFLGDNLVRMLAIPLTYLPMLLLAQQHLIQPTGSSVQESLGLSALPSGWSRCWQLVFMVLAAGLLGEWVLTLIAEPLGLSSHWAEGFDEALAWGDLPETAGSLVETTLFAPVFEEVVFRGLLFATLRCRYGFGPSALISSAIFAVAHGYGVLGFASVLWSGTLWAWAYEKSGSVLPGIVAHMVNNATVCLSIILFMR